MVSNALICRPRRILIVLVFIAVSAGCAGLQKESPPAAVPEIRPGILAGYLPQEVLPNSLVLIPPPPAAGSVAFELDKVVSQKNIALRGTPRWELAAKDAILMFPQAADAFSCALDAPITEKDTPYLYMLLRRTLADADLATYTAKNHYQRSRPFMMNDEPTCTPDDEVHLRKDGSYPSGHTSIGWAWALILSEIAPDRADTILARGRAFGESRNVCNVHWHSDVLEGRFMGAVTVSRLHADAAFSADLEAAKAEVAASRAKGLKPTRDCRKETEALAQQAQALTGAAEILQSWQGDYPLNQLNLLPHDQRDQPIGFLGDASTFENVWKAFKPGEDLPKIDPKSQLVIFTRHTQFYNRISIGKVNVKHGVVVVLTMETMSSMPIVDKVAMSMVIVARQGITAIRSGGEIILVEKNG